MSISLTSEQERFIQTKLQAGKYRSAQEILEIALRLLDEYDRANTAWIEDVREKIDAAISTSDKTPPIDGETFVSKILERFGASASDTKMSRYVINFQVLRKSRARSH